jgi:cell division protein FtsW (lipid II flippase)
MTLDMRVAFGLAVAMGASLAEPTAALAQSGEDIGQNVGQWLQEQAVWLWLGVGAIGSIVFLVNRRFGELVAFLCAMALIGVIVLAPDPLQSAIEGLAEQFLGG